MRCRQKKERGQIWNLDFGTRRSVPKSGAEASYKASVTRFKDALQLKIPDRVPVLLITTFML